MPLPFLLTLTAFAALEVSRGVVVSERRRRTNAGGASPEPAWIDTLARELEGKTLSFAAFAAGVIVAHLGGLDERRTTILAAAYVGSLVITPVLRLADLEYLRVAVAVAGGLAIAGLYLLPAG